MLWKIFVEIILKVKISKCIVSVIAQYFNDDAFTSSQIHSNFIVTAKACHQKTSKRENKGGAARH